MRTVPRKLPPLSYLLDDIANNEKAICEFLQVSPGMLRRWKKNDHAPKTYMLALFFGQTLGTTGPMLQGRISPDGHQKS